MTWNLQSATVHLNGFLNFPPTIERWLNPDNTYQVVFIQSQSSWFVVTGSDFVIDAHNTGGIQGNGQAWWSFFATRTREDGDGRPISLTLFKAKRGIIRNFRIESPPFWSNAVADSSDITYDGMVVNATNEDPLFEGQNIVWNTDGIDTYRSERITLRNWDVTCGDDCVAIKGNSSDIVLRNITCRGGEGIAIGSLGQYVNLTDNVQNVDMENIKMVRLDPKVQPNMDNGVYFKAWPGTVNGLPPTGGGGGAGTVRNLTAKNVQVDRVMNPVRIQIFQSIDPNGGGSPSKIKFENMHFSNWVGTANNSRLLDLECSVSGCSDFVFQKFNVIPPSGESPQYVCQNVTGIKGLSSPCRISGGT
ncbi:pectin lyase-like protein [Agrocybe pediades]|nr:pectin lyase-like protein [Agrocybe pediades]